MLYRFSGPVSVFHESRLPVKATPAGYSALIDAYGLAVPLPRTLSATGERHRIVRQGGWRILTPRHAPRPTLEGHLTFALKYEGLDLAVLKRLFLAVGPDEIATLVKAKPTGTYTRRLWFLHEWLLGERLDLADASSGRYVPVVEPERQWTKTAVNSRRHRVKDNLPGTPAFCPLVFRTELLDRLASLNLAQRAREIVGDLPRDILARAAAFLLLHSRSSYAIEGERPPQDRIQRWGRAIGAAGRRALDLEELLRLQGIVIGDARFVKLGLRDEGGFVGVHERGTHMPLPDHISARAEDLPGPTAWWRSTAEQRMSWTRSSRPRSWRSVSCIPIPSTMATDVFTAISFNVLAQRGFNPPGVVFPVSAAILARIHEYRRVLESYSSRLLPLIEWQPTELFNVRVVNDTGDFYRFFDATPQAEFLYTCVHKTIEEDLPNEADFLQRYDSFRQQTTDLVDMPDHTMNLLFRFLHQNGGRLSNRAREREFAALTDEEVQRIEQTFQEAFDGATKVQGGEGP